MSAHKAGFSSICFASDVARRPAASTLPKGTAKSARRALPRSQRRSAPSTAPAWCRAPSTSRWTRESASRRWSVRCSCSSLGQVRAVASPAPWPRCLNSRVHSLPAGSLARELLAAGFAEVAEFVEDLVADIPKAQEIFDGSAENVPSFNPKTNPVRTVALPTGCGPTLSAKACWPQKLRVRQSLCPLRSRSRSNLRG